MPRYVIEYRGGSIELPPGETVVGRGIACRIRFNDPAVSRRHLRLRVTQEDIEVVELGETNPTRLNDGPLPKGGCALKHGDVIEIGSTWFRVASVVEDDDEEQTSPGTDPGDLARGRPATARPSDYAGGGLSPSDGPLSSAIAATSEAISSRLDCGIPLPTLESQTCPRCRAKVPISSDDCPSCGYQWPTGRPVSVTQRIDVRAVKERLARSKRAGPERREHPRVVIDLPVIYDSEALTFDATCRDISFGGLFVNTELLDDIGTLCTVTILPDGAAALPLHGEVTRIVRTRAGAIIPGMGVRFTSLGIEARVWLTALFRQVAGVGKGERPGSGSQD